MDTKLYKLSVIRGANQLPSDVAFSNSIDKLTQIALSNTWTIDSQGGTMRKRYSPEDVFPAYAITEVPYVL